MSTEFEREERYIVFKLSDVEEHFTPGEKQQLARLVEVQRAGREEAGKPPLDCVVVEWGWPEYEPTWRAIEARVTGAQPAPSLPVEALGKMLADVMAVAVSNGANSVSMPDEYVEVAAWLRGISPQPAPSIPEGWKLVPIEPTETMISEGCAQQCWKYMIAVAPEVEP